MNKRNLLRAGLIGLTTVTGVKRHVFQAVTAVLFMLSTPAVAYASVSDGAGIGTGRLLPAAAAVVGLIGVIVGRQALSRSRRAGNGRSRAIVAGVLGLISIVIGVLHAANSAGGFGTGNGRAGAIVAIALGLIGLVLGGLTFARFRRIDTGSNTSAKTSSEERS